MVAVVGSVAVDVVPSAETFWNDFKTKTQPGARQAGDDLGSSIASPISDKVAKGVSDGLAKASPSTKEQGKQQGSGFADQFDKAVTTRLEAALKNLPDVAVGVNTTEAEAKLAEIRTTLIGLSDKNYAEVGLSDADAVATLAKLRVELDGLKKGSNDIRVRVDAGAASAELAALEAQIATLTNGGGGGGPDIGGLGAGAAGAATSISGLLLPALAGLGSTLLGPLAGVGGAAGGTLLLGLLGLQQQITDGLTPAFNDLENAASNALGPGVTDAITQIQQALPQLDPLISVFGAEFGKLIDQLATYLNNGGIESFVSYAERELPIVENAFISLTKAGIAFFTAVTPIGNALLVTLTDTADVLATIITGFNQINGAGANGNPQSPNSSLISQAAYAAGAGNNGYSKSFSNQPNAGDSGNGFVNFFHDISTFFSSGGSPTGTVNGQSPAGRPVTPVNQSASSAAANLANQIIAPAPDLTADANRANQLDALAAAISKANISAAALASTTLPRLAAQEQVAGLAAGQLASAMDTFGKSQDTVADKSKLLGAVLVASQGDALSYAGAIAGGYSADSALISTFQQQASDLAAQAASAAAASTKANQSKATASDGVTAANARLNASTAKVTAAEARLSAARANAKTTPAQLAAANSALAAAQSSVASSTKAVDSATTSLSNAGAAASSAGTAFANTELGSIDLKTGLINLKSQGAGPLVQQLQAMQDAAQKAAEATYQHEVSTKGDSQALQDAQDIFESMTGGTLVANAKQLGLTKDQAKKLADQYFAFPPNVTTDVQAVGLNDINDTLEQLGIQLSYLTKVPWVIPVTFTVIGGKALHDAVDSIAAGTYPAANQSSATQHAAGGLLSEGWNTAGKNESELMFKSGSTVQVFSAQVSAGIQAATQMPQSGAIELTTYTVLDGKVLAKSVSEHNAQNSRR